MEFLKWHYTKGINYYIDSWGGQLRWIRHYFSLPLLLRTLISPWRRMILSDNKPGFDLNQFFVVLTFNLISRMVGAGARLVLFFAGVILLLLSLLSGSLGFIFWFIIPIVSVPVYLRYKKQPSEYMQTLFYKMKLSKKPPLEFILDSEAGQFILSHLGIQKEEILKISDSEIINISELNYISMEELIKQFIEKQLWNKDDLRRIGLTQDDILRACKWWDEKRRDLSWLGGKDLGRPSIGVELLFGYTPTLNQYSVDLSAPQPFSNRLIGREDIVSRMQRELTTGNSIVITGDPGVGKKTVVLEFARRAVRGELGSGLAYKRVLEFDWNFLLSESMDLNQKKNKLALILEEAGYAGNIILMIRDLHRLIFQDLEGLDFTDIFESHLEKGDLKIIAVSTPIEYERFIAPNSRLRKYFQKVEVIPPSKEQAMEILLEVAKNLEIKNAVTLRIPVLRKILDESDRYITETPFPEKALELLEAVISYIKEHNGNVLTGEDVIAVFAEKTGISLAKMSVSEKEKLSKIEEIIHSKLVDQNAAVELIGQSLRAKTVGATENNRPIGSFLFLGPTGVGKTETAKVLADVYFGSEEKILRFDMAEYAGAEGLERLVGSVTRNFPGVLTTAIKNNPANLLLLDEFEKSSREIFNLFLTLLDEGYMTDAFGKRINGKNLFIVCTSNAGAEFIRQSVEKGIQGSMLQKSLINFVLENQIFSPELLNRFDGVIVYEPLGSEELKKVAGLLLRKFAEQLKKKGINLEILPQAVEKLAVDGFDPAFGARPMRRIIDLVLGDLIGKAILSGEISDGDTIKILPGIKKDEYLIQKTSA